MESDKTPSGDGMRSELLSASGWKDYELLDSGRFEKLERFGRYVLARPEPQAVGTARSARTSGGHGPTPCSVVTAAAASEASGRFARACPTVGLWNTEEE
mgnify:CR=1 FL=1